MLAVIPKACLHTNNLRLNKHTGHHDRLHVAKVPPIHLDGLFAQVLVHHGLDVGAPRSCEHSSIYFHVTNGRMSGWWDYVWKPDIYTVY